MSKIKHLLPDVPKYFKANLHTHTTVSDGVWTPEKTKQVYKENGYHIMAYTDHEVCIPHPELDDEDFLALTAYEFEVYQPGLPKHFRKSYHMNFISKTQLPEKQLYNHNYNWGNALGYVDQIHYDGNDNRAYSVEAVNDIIAQANKLGYLVSYNHPRWSLHNYSDYAGLKGLWAVEVYNNECQLLGYDDDNDAHVFQDLLNLGNTIYPLATDDFHELPNHQQIFGGWTMVGAQKLEYGAVIDALEKGDFYATTGPEIYSLTMEENKVKITCSDAVRIKLIPHCRMGQRLLSEPGQFVNEATFDLTDWLEESKIYGTENAWVRLTVMDAAGHIAYTRAYSHDEVTK